MTAKQPQAGEWWQQIDGTKYLCIAKNKHDETIWQVKDSGFRSLVGDYCWKHWQHLPDCDSWEWQPEVFPQYWTKKNTDSNRDVAFVELKQGGNWTQHYRDGGKYLMTVVPFQKKGRTQLTKEQAEALLDLPQPFTQEELTAPYQAIPAADLPPVESPDDWVTQDRVPPRHGIDQVQWSDWESSLWVNLPRGWYPPKIHGYRDEEDDTVLSVRCRRKDLPVMPSPVETPTNQQLFEMIANLRDQMAAMTKPIEVKSQPKCVPVRLYWYDGNIVGRYDHSQPTDPSFREIRHDGYKFYVEVQR